MKNLKDKLKFKKTLQSHTHPIKPKMIIKSKLDKEKERRNQKINLRKMFDGLNDLK